MGTQNITMPYINLDRVVGITDTEIGVEVIYGDGGNSSIFVEGKAFDILAKAGIMPSA